MFIKLSLLMTIVFFYAWISFPLLLMPFIVVVVGGGGCGSSVGGPFLGPN